MSVVHGFSIAKFTLFSLSWFLMVFESKDAALEPISMLHRNHSAATLMPPHPPPPPLSCHCMSCVGAPFDLAL